MIVTAVIRTEDNGSFFRTLFCYNIVINKITWTISCNHTGCRFIAAINTSVANLHKMFPDDHVDHLAPPCGH